jgi:predicted  nucleic acid-binding Zn-ribbon protein
MDVLTESEIQAINSKSKLVKKYSELIDRESAYELLTQKINAANEQATQAATQAATEAKEEKTSSGPSTTEVVTKSVLKVVTSATFIRGAFGILSKLFKK